MIQVLNQGGKGFVGKVWWSKFGGTVQSLRFVPRGNKSHWVNPLKTVGIIFSLLLITHKQSYLQLFK